MLLLSLSSKEYLERPILKNIHDTGRFIMFSVITNIYGYNKKTKGLTLMLP